jgi:hypothetical protein
MRVAAREIYIYIYIQSLFRWLQSSHTEVITRMFSGFKSRWQTLNRWQYVKPAIICLNSRTASSSGRAYVIEELSALDIFKDQVPISVVRR